MGTVRMRDLTKYIANLLTIQLHPRVIRLGGRIHLALFRLLRGAGPIGADTLILTTRGRISGQPRSTPLYYVENDGHRYVAASFAGNDTPPQWYLNAQTQPEVDVEIGQQRTRNLVRELSAEESGAIWRELIAVYPPFARYQQRTARRIPVIELTPVPGARPADPEQTSRDPDSGTAGTQ